MLLTNSKIIQIDAAGFVGVAPVTKVDSKHQQFVLLRTADGYTIPVKIAPVFTNNYKQRCISASTADGHNVMVALASNVWEFYDNFRQGDYRASPLYSSMDFDSLSSRAGSGNALFLDAEGRAWAIGNNLYGQLGNGTNTHSYYAPVMVSGDHVFTKLSIGQGFSVGIDDDGKAWAWGRNHIGQLGNGTFTNANVPVAVSGTHTFVDISAGFDHVLALDSSGNVWAWGRPNRGALGGNNNVGSQLDYNEPTQIYGSTTFASVHAENNISFAVTSGGQVWGWGRPEYLGIATESHSYHTWDYVVDVVVSSVTSLPDPPPEVGLLAAVTQNNRIYESYDSGGGDLDWRTYEELAEDQSVFGRISVLSSDVGFLFTFYDEVNDVIRNSGYAIRPIRMDTTVSFSKIRGNGASLIGIDSAGNVYEWGHTMFPTQVTGTFNDVAIDSYFIYAIDNETKRIKYWEPGETPTFAPSIRQYTACEGGLALD